MAYLFVLPAAEISMEVPLSDRIEKALAAQWQRLRDQSARDLFASRVAAKVEGVLADCLDWDIKEPTAAQVSFALAVSNELGAVIPPDALRYRGAMHEFLEENVPRAKARWAKRAMRTTDPD